MKSWCQKTSTETNDYKSVIWNETRHKNNALQKNPSKRAAASKEQSSLISNNISKLSENQKANRQGNGLKSSLKLQRQKFKPFQRSGKDFFKKIKFQQNQKILKPSIIGFVWALVKWKPYEGDIARIVKVIKVPLCLPVNNSQCHDVSFSICQE